MKGLQLFLFICVASFILPACKGQDSQAGILVSVGTEILHEDGRISSGYHELWASPRLTGDAEAAYRATVEAENEESEATNLAEDKDGRLWMACHGAPNVDYCVFDLVAYTCRERCVYDLKVRTVGRLESLPKDFAPWDVEPAENWATGSFDWAETAKRDRWDEVVNSKEDVGGTPAMQVQVSNGGLNVLLFPNRSF